MGAARGKAGSLFLTGLPGVGKTTVIRRLASALADRKIRGYTTEEIRSGKGRLGFRIESLQGEAATLAHVSIRSPFRVGRYGVDIEALDRIVELSLGLDRQTEVYLIDEIGRMECFSARFVGAVAALLDGGQCLVATVALHGRGAIAEFKARPGVELWTVTRENRDGLPARILEWLAAMRCVSTSSREEIT